MKIKKHGKFSKTEVVNTEKFKCDNCNCEFTALEDEYYVDEGGADSWATSSTITYTINSNVKDYLVCSCPECHKIVKKIRERKSSYSYTYNCVDPKITTVSGYAPYTVNTISTSGFDELKL